MSLIGSAQDPLHHKRRQSMQQEAKIDRHTWLASWQRSDATKPLMIERLFGLAVLPLALAWAFILACFSIGLGVCLALFRFLGRLLR